jgi:hypothetical protein
MLGLGQKTDYRRVGRGLLGRGENADLLIKKHGKEKVPSTNRF